MEARDRNRVIVTVLIGVSIGVEPMILTPTLNRTRIKGLIACGISSSVEYLTNKRS